MKIEEIVKESLAGNLKAQRQLFDNYSSMLLGVCRRYAKNQYQADDMFQEAFINIFNNLHQWSSLKGAFEPWIYRITVNTALAIIKKETKHFASDVDEEINISSVSGLHVPIPVVVKVSVTDPEAISPSVGV